ncbi:hypothetical protein Nepgr_029600 [Nepenthes gracilis]|uniref:B box-type domain-containing protein n=1 Tax=Nepenthes gracilis TaxID=150966 RepID=A0AAD3TEB9_NEPGR|nr:hypothetical protein Nepgr_029600 [Nepenthes gracilis]
MVGVGGKKVAVAAELPAWLQGLTGERFFSGCGVHLNRRKNEKNIFCLACCLSFCPHCLPSHRSHPLLQVRRYVYHDVVRLDDLQKLIDCSYIQPYTINGAKVIFLNQRPQSRQCKGGSSANVCFTCDRILQNPFHFCSLSCKVDHLVQGGEDLTDILYRFEESDFVYTQFEGDASEELDDDAQAIENSIMEVEDQDPPLQFKTPSCSHDVVVGSSGMSNPREAAVAVAASKTKKKKEKGGDFLPGIVMSLNSCRRKGAPQRSPLS